MALQHLRTSTAHKRPIPSVMSAGQLAININEASPGLFFKDSNGDLVKVGPVHIGTDAPNSSPASVAATALVTGTVYQILTVGTSDFTLVGASANTVGTVFTATGTTTGDGTVSGQQGVEKGEQWLDTTGGNYVLKIYDGTAWRSEAGEFVNVTGDTMTGDLVFNNADIVFEGATADDFETTLTVTDPTADRTITLPDTTGTVVTTGDTGSVTSTMILDGTIVNADINASAEIAVSKLANGTARQLLQTDAAGTGVEFTSNVDVPGTLDVTGAATLDSTLDVTGVISADGKISFTAGTSALPAIYSGTDTNTGIYSPGADQFAISTAGTSRLHISSGGNVGIGTSSPAQPLHIAASIPSIRLEDTDWNGYHSITDNANGDLLFVGNASSTGGVSSDIRFQSAGSELVRFTSGGNVGIGTSSPDRLLEIAGSGGASNVELRINATDGGERQITFIGAGSTTQSIKSTGTTDNSLVFVQGPNERMRIDNTGNVGIGKSAPETTLHLRAGNPTITLEDGTGSLQTSISGDGGELAYSIAGSEAMRIDSSGNVGIGTASPAGQLHVDSSGDTSVFITAGTTTTDANLYFGDSAGAFRGLIQYDNSAEALIFHANGVVTENFRTLSSGGITFNGDTAAANALDDYEEGTWTPTLTNALTYTTQEGQYTKIGNFVYVQARIQVATFTSTSSAAIISGLPFTTASAAGSGGFGSAYFGFGTLSTDVTSNEIALHMPANSNQIQLRAGGARTGLVAVNSGLITYTRAFIVCGSYRVT